MQLRRHLISALVACSVVVSATSAVCQEPPPGPQPPGPSETIKTDLVIEDFHGFWLQPPNEPGWWCMVTVVEYTGPRTPYGVITYGRNEGEFIMCTFLKTAPTTYVAVDRLYLAKDCNKIVVAGISDGIETAIAREWIGGGVFP